MTKRGIELTTRQYMLLNYVGRVGTATLNGLPTTTTSNTVRTLAQRGLLEVTMRLTHEGEKVRKEQ